MDGESTLCPEHLIVNGRYGHSHTPAVQHSVSHALVLKTLSAGQSRVQIVFHLKIKWGIKCIFLKIHYETFGSLVAEA